MTEKLELDPGFYIVLPGGEIAHWIIDEENESVEHLAYSLAVFVTFLQTQWPALNKEEASWLANAIIHSLPELFRSNPELLEELNQDVAAIKAGKHRANR